MRDKLTRILIVTKYRFIGDTLVAVPTIRAVKARWPNSEISLLSGARACELLQNCPYVDEYIEFDPYRQSDKGLRPYIDLLRRLRRDRFDLALVLNRSFHSALTAALGGARRRAGWKGFECRDFLLTDGCVYDKDQPEIGCMLDVLECATGHAEQNSSLEVWLTEAEIREAARFLPTGGFLIGIQPGATHAYKQWPLIHFIEASEQLVRNDNQIRIVLLGGPDELSIAEKFVSLSSPMLLERTTNLVGSMSLRSTLAAVSQLNAFVGNDTAIRHAAVAVDVPSVALFGPTSCSKWGNASPPNHIVLTSITGKMDDILVETVIDAIDRLNTPGGVSATMGSLPNVRIRDLAKVEA